MMSNIKRPPPDDSSSPSPNSSKKSTKTKPDGSSADYSSDVRKKLQSSNRTGQACDRCRMRKMRCDGRPDGCAPCTQNHTPCKTTDRMTGIANERGHVKRLEHRIRELETHIRGLEGRLMSLGEDVKPWNIDHDYTPAVLQWSSSQEQETSCAWESRNNSTVRSDPGSDGNLKGLPEFRHGLAGDNYLGVSSGNSFISSIRGTALNVLGAEIDLADFMSADLDDPDPMTLGPEYPLNKSYHAFVQTAFSANPKPPKVQLPPQNQAMTYVQWYFRTMNPYMPFLHKPTFTRMLSRVYDNNDPFEPSVAETVTIHMLFAIMYYQYASRNWQNIGQQSGLNDVSNRHYHYALSFFPKLMTSHTIHDVQALAMIAFHMRSFPKPGPCWMLSTTLLNLAIELGLHRSAKQWAVSTPEKSTFEIEMRKRIFWSILNMHVSICGKLGRPMALHENDFDVELPEAVDDDLLAEHGLESSKNGKCDFLVAIESYKILPAVIDLYRNIFGIKRSSQQYIRNIQRFEEKFRDWRGQWPYEMKIGGISSDTEGRIHSQYLEIVSLEFRLLLRHPSVSLSSSAEFNNESLTICMDASRQILQHVKVLQKYKSLDTNWQTGALYVFAISTTLYGHWKRADQITSEGLAALRRDMDEWLSIIGELSGLIGSGNRLQEAIRATVDRTLYMLEQHLSPQANVASLENNYAHYGEQNVASLFPPSDGSDITTQTAIQYSSPTQYSFSGSSTSYGSNSHTGVYAPTAYAGSEPLSANSPQATPNAANSYAYGNVSSSTNAGLQPAITMAYTAGPVSSWRELPGHVASPAGNMLSPAGPHEYLNSASSAIALMQLGQRNGQSGDPTMQAANDMSGMSEGVGQQWPLMVLDGRQAGN